MSVPRTLQYDLAELCMLTGVTPRTVRYYIQQGLLPSAAQPGPGANYGDEHLERLRLIRQLQRDHLPLAEIRRRFETLDDQTVAEAGAQPEGAGGAALAYVHTRLARSGTPALARRPVPPSPPASGSAAAAAQPPPPASGERSQWERIRLTRDVELHVRRPLSREDNRRVERLVREARRMLEEVP